MQDICIYTVFWFPTSSKPKHRYHGKLCNATQTHSQRSLNHVLGRCTNQYEIKKFFCSSQIVEISIWKVVFIRSTHIRVCSYLCLVALSCVIYQYTRG